MLRAEDPQQSVAAPEEELWDRLVGGLEKSVRSLLLRRSAKRNVLQVNGNATRSALHVICYGYSLPVVKDPVRIRAEATTRARVVNQRLAKLDGIKGN